MASRPRYFRQQLISISSAAWALLLYSLAQHWLSGSKKKKNIHTHRRSLKIKIRNKLRGWWFFSSCFMFHSSRKWPNVFPSTHTHTHTYSKWRGVAPVLRVIFFVFFRLVVLFILLRFIFTVHIAQVKLKLKLKLALNAPLFELAWVICISPLLASPLFPQPFFFPFSCH